MHKILKLLPYALITLISVFFFVMAQFIESPFYWTVATNIGSNALFILIAYLFYDLIKSYIKGKEKEDLDEYIKNRIETDSLFVLHYLKQIIHGYNLDTNTLSNIFGILNYSEYELRNSISNQSYLGFQRFKQINGLRDLFINVLNNNLFLKHSSYLEDTNLIKINNLLYKIELLLKNEQSFIKCAEHAIEYTVVDAKDINPDNNEGYILLKKTKIPSRFVVYDSGNFNKEDSSKLLYRYTLNEESVELLSKYTYELLSYLKYWMPQTINLPRQEARFRVIDKYFNPATQTQTAKTKIHVADIIDCSNKMNTESKDSGFTSP